MYNIKAVSNLLDMPKVTIRSWETRYNAISPARTEGGHRLYSEQNIEDLQWLKIQVQNHGMKISEAVRQLHASKKTAQTFKEETGAFSSQSYGKQIQELFGAAAEMDTERFNYLLDLNFSLFHHRTVFFDIITPLMVRIGEEWENGTISVAHEHLITSIIQQRFKQFFRIFPVRPELPKVMALCPSGEHHQLGLLLFSLFLRENGHPVLYFGADTPLDGLAEVAASQEIDMVAFSYSSEKRKKTVDEYMEALSKEQPDLHFVIGGLGAAAYGELSPGTSASSWQEWLHNIKATPKRHFS